MSRIIVITGNFKIYDRNGMDTYTTEFTASHGINEDTGETVILPCVHPADLSATWDAFINEWVIDN